MAFVSYVDINPADEVKFYSGLNASDRFLYSKIKKKKVFFSRHAKSSLVARSLLSQISTIWATLNVAEKALWTTSGSYSNLNGWRAFVSEMSIRLKLGFSTSYTPSIYHQGWLGHLIIENPAQQIKIAQYHPESYYVYRKVTGVKGLFAPVLVTEKIYLPLQIGISYKSNLTAVGGSQYIKFYAIVRSSYQGVDRENIVELNLDAVTDWKTVTATLSVALGYVIGYTLYIHVFGYIGDLYFDNIKAIHSAVNWVRDTRCNDINITFTNQYYQISKHWVALELPAGSSFDSDYLN